MSAFWKVVVDPAQHEALAFMVPQNAITKGDLKPWETTIADIEKTAGVELPVGDLDLAAKPALWLASIAGYRKEHKAACNS
ncbi:MAG TPA: DNA/RNA non-specific endonuclease [Dongiaceae bacterium]|nr:DNA/RNA non-specific endonuclease [Dongiaceae bacterium]